MDEALSLPDKIERLINSPLPDGDRLQVLICLVTELSQKVATLERTIGNWQPPKRYA